MSLKEFLDHKTMFYEKIDYECIEKSYEQLQEHIQLPYVIHIIGTNGKGSTGRFLASFLHQNNKSVLHYSSPHILKFNERIWIDGSNSSDSDLEQAHQKLQVILDKKYLDQLTYFEYTTLLAIVLGSGKEYLVFEAGLGGEFDATNVVKNDVSVLTTIGLDHQDFLGDTIEAITATKVRSCDKTIFVSYQEYDIVYKTVYETLVNKEIFEVRNIQPQIDYKMYEISEYLQRNLHTVFCLLSYLGFPIKQYQLPKLFGRFESLSPNIIIDVGHNPLAALAISKELKKDTQKYILIYNSYKDKDFSKNLQLLSDVIKKVLIIEIDDKRIVDKKVLQTTLDRLSLQYEDFSIEKLESREKYLVFGSFLVVENFLKQYG
ncbi:MAG: bifunctional folylpolyglutamate synthase/dihydrofolate synthase [Campylobacterales bacterium]|nr:bifunctional folylpolyglutamate synthase/dihydrofolate synthase [Campylobacterales bacterium]